MDDKQMNTATEQEAADNTAACEQAAEQTCEEKVTKAEKKKLKKAEAEIEKLTAELNEEKDKYMRLYAEFDNFRKRSAKVTNIQAYITHNPPILPMPPARCRRKTGSFHFCRKPEHGPGYA